MHEAESRWGEKWDVIHHGVPTNGNDHIHIAATMVREDGTRWDGRINAYKTTQTAARAIEVMYGSATVGGRKFGTAVRGEKPAERVNAKRAGLGQTAPGAAQIWADLDQKRFRTTAGQLTDAYQDAYGTDRRSQWTSSAATNWP